MGDREGSTSHVPRRARCYKGATPCYRGGVKDRMKTVPVSRVRSVVTILALLLGFLAAVSGARGEVEKGFHLTSGPVEVRGVPGIYQWRFEDSLGPSTS